MAGSEARELLPVAAADESCDVTVLLFSDWRLNGGRGDPADPEEADS